MTFQDSRRLGLIPDAQSTCLDPRTRTCQPSPKCSREPYREIGVLIGLCWRIDVKVQAVFRHSEFGVMHLEKVLM